MHRLALAFALVAVGSMSAAAGPPITVGAAAGITETAIQSSTNDGPSSVFGLYARMRATSRLAAQLDLEQVDALAGKRLDYKRGTLLLVVDLVAGTRWVPVLFAGGGFDRAVQYGSETDGHHFEGGLGIEYRSSGGLVLGLDVRMGGHAIDSQPPIAYYCNDLRGCGGSPNSTLTPGDYRSARFTIGARF
jgi:hypothetical protein